jgi:hypothetical protein
LRLVHHIPTLGGCILTHTTRTLFRLLCRYDITQCHSPSPKLDNATWTGLFSSLVQVRYHPVPLSQVQCLTAQPDLDWTGLDWSIRISQMFEKAFKPHPGMRIGTGDMAKEAWHERPGTSGTV